MFTFQSSTGPVAYDDRGEGIPVVLLPSGAHDHHDYDELRSLLPTRYRTIALDWPGHGDSPAGEGPASGMRFADIAEELVSSLAPGGAVVVGNSVGGFAAARLAIRRPALVGGLVLIDSGGFVARPPQVRMFCALKSFASPEHDLRSQASAINVPTLLIWGRRDPVIPVSVGRRLSAVISHSRLVEFDTGHVPHTSDPEGVAAELLRFADEVSGSCEVDAAA